MSADLIVIDDGTLTPNPPSDYEKFRVRTVLVRAEGAQPVRVSSADAILQALQPLCRRLAEPRVLICCLGSNNLLLAVRSMSFFDAIVPAIDETALSVGAPAVIVAGVTPTQPDEEFYRWTNDLRALARRHRETCAGTTVLDFLVVHPGGGYSLGVD